MGESTQSTSAASSSSDSRADGLKGTFWLRHLKMNTYERCVLNRYMDYMYYCSPGAHETKWVEDAVVPLECGHMSDSEIELRPRWRKHRKRINKGWFRTHAPEQKLKPLWTRLDNGEEYVQWLCKAHFGTLDVRAHWRSLSPYLDISPGKVDVTAPDGDWSYEYNTRRTYLHHQVSALEARADVLEWAYNPRTMAGRRAQCPVHMLNYSMTDFPTLYELWIMYITLCTLIMLNMYYIFHINRICNILYFQTQFRPMKPSGKRKTARNRQDVLRIGLKHRL